MYPNAPFTVNAGAAFENSPILGHECPNGIVEAREGPNEIPLVVWVHIHVIRVHNPWRGAEELGVSQYSVLILVRSELM